MVSQYEDQNIPLAMMVAVKNIVANPKWGFETVDEFVLESIRRNIMFYQNQLTE